MQTSEKKEVFKIVSYKNEIGERTVFGIESPPEGFFLSSLGTASIMVLILDAFVNAVSEEYQTTEEQNVLRYFSQNIGNRYNIIDK